MRRRRKNKSLKKLKKGRKRIFSAPTQKVREMQQSEKSPKIRARRVNWKKKQERNNGDSDTVLTPQVVEKGKGKQKSQDKDISIVLFEGANSDTESDEEGGLLLTSTPAK